MVDTPVSEAGGRKPIGVQVPSSAPTPFFIYVLLFGGALDQPGSAYRLAGYSVCLAE